MRRWHYKRNPDHCPGVNIDRLWSLMPEGVYEKSKSLKAGQAACIDVTKKVRLLKLRKYFPVTSISYLCYRDISRYWAREDYQKFR